MLAAFPLRAQSSSTSAMARPGCSTDPVNAASGQRMQTASIQHAAPVREQRAAAGRCSGSFAAPYEEEQQQNAEQQQAYANGRAAIRGDECLPTGRGYTVD